ncbi:Fe-S cluster assembly protein SufD [Nitratireductor kimnyeongensis]|uniref:Fe-S cluster assembly protein SufD n=1 Tax=Nitratireductor kimnyeongensis TaxID=430679 RepID=A0ABW0TBF5_9HYPH|nr:Fe-S cluster assembly protein SufD [Nitratireductor kimnyeongensis]QZZ35622.1 Fe-S cluster assembly protein SufD [Nitratireductor kimnyeongensis]
MNLHAQNTLTEAETALVDGYSSRFSDLPGDAEVTVRRDEALELLKKGLPTRRIEAWHYTDLRRLLSSVPEFKPVNDAEAVAPLIENALVLPVLNGTSHERPAAPEGATIATLAEKLQEGALSANWLTASDRFDAVGAINAAFVSDGYWLEIAEGTEIERPVELQNIHAGGQVHGRFVVNAAAGSKATIIERQTGVGDALATSVTHLDVGDGADVFWILLQEQPDDATYLGQFTASLGKDSSLTLFILNSGGKLVRQEVKVVARGEGSEFKLRGVNLLGGEAHCDVTMVLDHLAPDTVSTETFRNVVTGKANGVFQGQIRVAKIAQKTDAKMACNTLLLSDEGGFSSKPELEIFADDVACGHGATVTDIEEDHLFYLMARGIDEKTARGLLVKAFVAEVIEELEDEIVIEALEARLVDWFAAHG